LHIKAKNSQRKNHHHERICKEEPKTEKAGQGKRDFCPR
jgi:hypothetical protein